MRSYCLSHQTLPLFQPLPKMFLYLFLVTRVLRTLLPITHSPVTKTNKIARVPISSVSVKASAYGIGGRPAASPRFPLPLKKSAYGQTRKMRPENGQISYKNWIFLVISRFIFYEIVRNPINIQRIFSKIWKENAEC